MKIIKPDELASIIGPFHRKRKVIMCCGCFDICHPGHIRHLTFAKSKADILVVSITADRFITKGIYRPHVPEQIRAESLAALEMVDYVIIDENADHLINIAALKPDFFAKGFEYSDQHHEATVAEIALVEGYGGQMLFTPGDVVYSSTKLLNTHLPPLGIEKLHSLMKQCGITFDTLRGTVARMGGYKAHVVGDTIIDTYTRTNLVGSNAKTPTFSVTYDGHEDYIGGAAIVAQHLIAAGAEVKFTTILGNDQPSEYALLTLRESGIEVNAIIDDTRPTTRKTALIAGDSRMLKVDIVDSRPISSKIAARIQNSIADDFVDTMVFSDFRHGIFNKSTIPSFTRAIPDNAFKVADSQVASRWGNITEFMGFDLVTPNEKEARFSLADQDSNIGQLAGAIKDRCKAQNVILKLGARGIFLLNSTIRHSVDSFACTVKDAVGAGDALLAYSTLAMLASGSIVEASIIGSLAAACECEIDGNVPIKPEDVLTKLDHVEKL